MHAPNLQEGLGRKMVMLYTRLQHCSAVLLLEVHFRGSFSFSITRLWHRPQQSRKYSSIFFLPSEILFIFLDTTNFYRRFVREGKLFVSGWKWTPKNSNTRIVFLCLCLFSCSSFPLHCSWSNDIKLLLHGLVLKIEVSQNKKKKKREKFFFPLSEQERDILVIYPLSVLKYKPIHSA